MAQNKDFYAVLGVSASASPDEIKKQYRKLAKRYHPDANQGEAKAAERFKEISEAYTVLGDAAKRKQYDEMRRLGAFEGFGGFGGARPGGARPGAGSRAGGAAGGPNVRFEDFDIGGLGGLGDLFSSMFGGGRQGGARPHGPERGQNVESTLAIPFRVAVLGGKIPIDLEVNEECPTCKGTGAAPGAKFSTCTECGGRGMISFGQGGFAVNRPCPVCLGRGQVPSERCPTCQGSGETRVHRTVNISVAPGTDTGTRVRLSGQGGKGASGGPPGDLIITFQVQPDRFFSREGNDLVAHVPLNIAQATLGSRVSVRSISGRKIAIRIPAGTPSGKRFRVRGQGVATGDETGDLIVEVSITVPESLTPEQEEMMRNFAAAGGIKY